jgi:uracil-DNA glycosylase
MHPSWKASLATEFRQPYFEKLRDFVRDERRAHTIFPREGEVFAAFDGPFDAVKVCILGQDPYHGPGQAHGLAFSVRKGMPIPPSLLNIYKELGTDVGFKSPGHGCLQEWVDRGVLLLNTSLTVRAHEAGSHSGQGWERFTDAVIRVLADRDKPVVFVLWGSHAKKKVAFLDPVKHTVVSSAHPSPLSAHAGFFGSRPFSTVNRALGDEAIDWQLTP